MAFFPLLKYSTRLIALSAYLVAAGCDDESPADDTAAGTGGASCGEACGDDPCILPNGNCLGEEPVCVPPAPDACSTCIEDACADALAQTPDDCSGTDCLDYTVRIGSCGDASPYAPEGLLSCAIESCDDVCNLGADFTCACI